jgi:betaine lipid synthase
VRNFTPSLSTQELILVGWNIEAMDAYFPISQFDAVYLVDLCQPLLDVALKRFRERGFKNITCICQDASTFTLPEWTDGVHPRGSVGFVTLSYSLSMARRLPRSNVWLS